MNDIKTNNYIKERHGRSEELESDTLIGCTIENVFAISKMRKEPDWMLQYRLNAFNVWKQMSEPHWIYTNYTIDYDKVIVFSVPKAINDPSAKERIINTFQRIGVSKEESERIRKIALDAVFDSTSVYTSHQEELKKYGVVFCSMSDAVINYSDIVKKYFGTVVPSNDNFFAALNSAFFSDGTFVYVPKGINVPMDLSSYFRIDSMVASQFERTLIISEDKSFVNYLEGCSAPISKNHQLHAAVVEIVALKEATVNYFTLQNWFTGDKGVGGVYNFVTKRGLCLGELSEINWLQVEVGSLITWKYPSCILLGNRSKGSFYSISMSENYMYIDSGTKMIHMGEGTKSTVHSKSIVLSNSRSVFRSKTKFTKKTSKCEASSRCDTMIKGESSISDALPVFEDYGKENTFKHEATVSHIDAARLFYLETKGFTGLQAQKLLFNCFVRDIVEMLPEEFYAEASALLEMKFDDNA